MIGDSDRIRRAQERMLWLLRHMTTPSVGSSGSGFIVAWDTDTVDKFVIAFPEAKNTLVVYLMGPNSSPMLNRAAKKAHTLGYIEPGVIGCQDARSYNQRTWSRTWTITPDGRRAIALAP